MEYKTVTDIKAKWDRIQASVAKYKIISVGNTPLTSELLLSLTAAGLGEYHIFDNRIVGDPGTELLYLETKPGRRATDGFEKLLKKIRPAVELKHETVDLEADFTAHLEGVYKPNLIVDTSADTETKSVSLAWAEKNNVPIISGFVDGRTGRFVYSRSIKEDRKRFGQSYIEKFEDAAKAKDQDSVGAGMLAATLTWQISDVLYSICPERPPFGIKDDKNGPLLLWSDPVNQMKFDFSKDINYIAGKRFLVVGCGNVGSQVARLLAAKGAKHLTLVDADYIEDRNLPRQWLFYDRASKDGKYKKSFTVGERISKMYPCTSIDAVADNFSEAFKTKYDIKDYDVYISAVDKFVPRIQLQCLAAETGRPMTDGGLGYAEGGSLAFIYGKTACLHCSDMIDKDGLKAELKNSSKIKPFWDRGGGCEGILHWGAVPLGLFVAAAHAEAAERALARQPAEKIYFSEIDKRKIFSKPLRKRCDCTPADMKALLV